MFSEIICEKKSSTHLRACQVFKLIGMLKKLLVCQFVIEVHNECESIFIQLNFIIRSMLNFKANWNVKKNCFFVNL